MRELWAQTRAFGLSIGVHLLVAALVSIVGLSKIIIANMFFYIMIQDDARLDEEEPAPPPNDGSRKTVPLRRVPRAMPRNSWPADVGPASPGPHIQAGLMTGTRRSPCWRRNSLIRSSARIVLAI